MAFKKVIVDYLGRLAEMLAADTIHPDQLGTGVRDGTKVLRDDGTWVVNSPSGAILYNTVQSLTTTEEEQARINIGIDSSSGGEFGRVTSFTPSVVNLNYSIPVKGISVEEFGNNLWEVSLNLNSLTGNSNGSIATPGDEFVIIIAKVENNTSGFSYTENNTGITLKNVGDYVIYSYNANTPLIIETNVGEKYINSRSATISNIITNIYIDPTTGVDGLPFTSYLGSTASTGNRFLTINAALDWVNKYQGEYIKLFVTGTTAGSPLEISSDLNIVKKMDFSILGSQNAGAIAYLRFNTGGYITTRASLFSISRCNIAMNQTDGLWVGDYGTLRLSNLVTITLGASTTSGICVSGSGAKLDIQTNFSFNFSANNQVFVHASGNGGCTIMFSNHSTNNTWTTSTYTGLKWTDAPNIRSVETYFVENTPAPTIPSNLDMSGSLLHFGSKLAIVQTIFDTTAYNYALTLGTTSPLKFSNLNSSSSNMTFTTKKKLIVDEYGEVGVLDDTGGSGGIAIDVKSVDLRGVLDTGTNGVGTNIFGYTVVLGDKVLLKDINADWGVFTVEASSMTLTSQDSIVHVSDGSYSGYIYSYDNFNGQYRLVGDNATITGIITLDFGNEDNKAFNQIDITGTGLQNESEIKNISIIPQETTETSIDDFVLNNVSFFISNLNNSFDTIDIIGIANNGASGVYTVRYTITY